LKHFGAVVAVKDNPSKHRLLNENSCPSKVSISDSDLCGVE
jgi:hypothetical protein